MNVRAVAVDLAVTAACVACVAGIKWRESRLIAQGDAQDRAPLGRPWATERPLPKAPKRHER